MPNTDTTKTGERTQYTPGPWRLLMLTEGIEEAPRNLTEEQRARWSEIMAERNRPMRDNDGAFIIIGGNSDERCRVGTASLQVKAKQGTAHAVEDPEGLANARLIAAAPELLEACNALIGAGKYGRDGVCTLSTAEVVEMARAAISKVTQ